MTAPDFSLLARKPSEQLAVVEFVAATPELEETYYLEWKSSYDLSTNPGAGKTAKQLIGMANRDPAQAGRHLEGHAYVLLGVEAGRVVGVPQRWDSADIENWLSRFVGGELTYEVSYVRAEEKDILFLTVRPPRQGDPILALQRSTGDDNESLNEGTVYVRHGGKTEPANAADIERLTRRAQALGTELQVEVAADASQLVPMSEELLSDDFRDRYLANRRKVLMQGVPSVASSALEKLSLASPSISETRSPRSFRAEVDRFVEHAGRTWTTYSLYKFIEAGPPTLRLSVINHTDDNFEQVVVEATIRLPRGFVHSDLADAHEQLKPAAQPARWGAGLAGRFASPRISGRRESFGIEVEALDDHATQVRFPPFHAYPQTTHKLPPVVVAVPAQLEGREMSIDWTATARNTKGKIAGTVSFTVLGEAPATKAPASNGGSEGAEPAET